MPALRQDIDPDGLLEYSGLHRPLAQSHVQKIPNRDE